MASWAARACTCSSRCRRTRASASTPPWSRRPCSQRPWREPRAPRLAVKAAVAQQCRAGLADEDAAARKLRLVTATYAVPRRCPNSGGWLGMSVGDGATVSSIKDGGATDLLMTVAEGWRVVSVGGTRVSDAGSYDAAVTARKGKHVEVVFERAIPPLPHRGWARRHVRRRRGPL